MIRSISVFVLCLLAVGGGALHLSSLVLGDLVLLVLAAILALAVCLAGLGDVDLFTSSASAWDLCVKFMTPSVLGFGEIRFDRI